MFDSRKPRILLPRENSYPYGIAACCTLQNICENHGDVFNEVWLEDCESEEVFELLISYFVQNLVCWLVFHHNFSELLK